MTDLISQASHYIKRNNNFNTLLKFWKEDKAATTLLALNHVLTDMTNPKRAVKPQMTALTVNVPALFAFWVLEKATRLESSVISLSFIRYHCYWITTLLLGYSPFTMNDNVYLFDDNYNTTHAVVNCMIDLLVKHNATEVVVYYSARRGPSRWVAQMYKTRSERSVHRPLYAAVMKKDANCALSRANFDVLSEIFKHLRS